MRKAVYTRWEELRILCPKSCIPRILRLHGICKGEDIRKPQLDKYGIHAYGIHTMEQKLRNLCSESFVSWNARIAYLKETGHPKTWLGRAFVYPTASVLDILHALFLVHRTPHSVLVACLPEVRPRLAQLTAILPMLAASSSCTWTSRIAQIKLVFRVLPPQLFEISLQWTNPLFILSMFRGFSDASLLDDFLFCAMARRQTTDSAWQVGCCGKQ